MDRIVVSSLDGKVITAMYAENTELHIPLATGIYIIKVGEDTVAKVLVR